MSSSDKEGNTGRSRDPSDPPGRNYTVTEIPAAERDSEERARRALVEALAEIDDVVGYLPSPVDVPHAQGPTPIRAKPST